MLLHPLSRAMRASSPNWGRYSSFVILREGLGVEFLDSGVLLHPLSRAMRASSPNWGRYSSFVILRGGLGVEFQIAVCFYTPSVALWAPAPPTGGAIVASLFCVEVWA